MVKFEIILLKNVNGLKFGASSQEVHTEFGSEYEHASEKLTTEDKDFLLEVSKRMSEMSGRPLEDFTKYDKEEFDSDTSDYYSFCRIDYDEEGFEAIEIYSDKETKLIVNGKDYSNFDLQTLLTLADDFQEKENKTSYISNSKQIGIWCPDGDGRVESILFGCPGYYDSLNDL